ncbi:hypothetical protein FQN50_009672 [Emmonsiellopsis sp. PD_5]|nr:hypothetical protein FQN50_009672 [Emmonsiellopsis sp. PD_5]
MTSFEAKKQKILEDLAVPDEEYTDLSPKGSVDAGIRDLIYDINQIPGLVTTSSCAGRISVFLEGGGRREGEVKDLSKKEEPESIQFAPTGGKGSGKWLFVSHDPVQMDLSSEGDTLHELFNLTPGNGNDVGTGSSGSLRLILHIMATSLKHAQPVLAAATAAGFRESGLQSLRCLDESDAYPIVAVRSSGLALESIIGHVQVQHDDHGVVQSLVPESYLRMLLAAANERFKTNAERRARFWMKLQQLETGSPGGFSLRKAGWEDPEVRRRRKREEGLRRREAVLGEKAVAGGPGEREGDGDGDEEDLPLLLP